MDIPKKLAKQGTPAIKNGQSRETSKTGYTGYQKWTIQRNYQHRVHRLSKMDNSEKLATQGTPAIKNGQSRETSNTGYTGYQKWTIQRN
jgi:predicted secreted protein